MNKNPPQHGHHHAWRAKTALGAVEARQRLLHALPILVSGALYRRDVQAMARVHHQLALVGKIIFIQYY